MQEVSSARAAIRLRSWSASLSRRDRLSEIEAEKHSSTSSAASLNNCSWSLDSATTSRREVWSRLPYSSGAEQSRFRLSAPGTDSASWSMNVCPSGLPDKRLLWAFIPRTVRAPTVPPTMQEPATKPAFFACGDQLPGPAIRTKRIKTITSSMGGPCMLFHAGHHISSTTRDHLEKHSTHHAQTCKLYSAELISF